MDFNKLQNLHRQTVNNLKTLLMSYAKIFSLGFSGGKDSSSTAAALLEAMMELKYEGYKVPEVYVLYSDTLMELLPVQVHTYKVLEKIKKFANENDLPVRVMHAKPKTSDTMWSMMIGRGIRPPSSDARWCTQRLKTDVQESVLYEAFKTTDIETISIVGSRKEESADRKQRLENNTIDGHLKGHNQFTKSLVYAPIEDYTTEDVWVALRTSKIGREVLDAESLYELYASTQGEGEECQTVLGNAGENGKNPGCSKSGGRFGCWNCGLLPKGGDKALRGMQKTHPYIKHLITFRDWNVGLRDGQWHILRDVYNHEHFTRLQYNLDNHRFGMTAPGGMTLSVRAETLLRLLDTEQKVREGEDLWLITDGELAYIQHRWIREGDLSLKAVEIAKRFGRDIKVSNEDQKLVRYAKAFYLTQSIWENGVKFWYGINPDERFAAQFVLQTIKAHSFTRMELILEEIIEYQDETKVAELLKKMQLKNQFYPFPELEKMIRREWENDEVSYVTKALINDYENSWPEDRLEHYDPLEDPKITMEDKYAILDNWTDYVGYDCNERFEHPEYMRFGGHRQYVTFRERQSEENRTKNKRKQEVKIAALMQQPAFRQQSFDFAA